MTDFYENMLAGQLHLRTFTKLTSRFSQMDIGVGSFVFSSGLVSARPIVKDPKYLSQNLIPKLLNALGSCIPILVLGIVRVLLVKGTEYPVCCHPRPSAQPTDFGRNMSLSTVYTGTSF